MRSHIELQTQENIKAGMSATEAHYAALRQFRQKDGFKSICREQRGGVWIECLMDDLRYAMRMLRKHYFGNAVIVLTIALLLGAVSVMYASLRKEQMRLAPFPDAGRIVKLARVGEKRFDQHFPAALFLEYRDRLQSFEAFGALSSGGTMTLTGEGDPAGYQATSVSAAVLEVAGIPPLRGRLFDDSDEVPGENRVLIISEQLWREKLGADEGIIGRMLRLNDQLYTVIGVLPERMRTTYLDYRADVWMPQRFERNRPGARLRLVGRLKGGVAMSQAQAELGALAPRLEQEYTPDQHEKAVYPGGFASATLLPLNKQIHGLSGGVPLQLLLVWVFAGTIFTSVVGIACFNVTNLLLARASARSREIAIRLSLGARRLRIVRQLLAETVLLSLIGGVFGLVVSFWLLGLLRLQRLDSRFDWQIYLIAAAGALVLGIVVGLLPALRSARTDLTEKLKDGGQSVGGRRRHGLRNFLVSSEVAMALVLSVVGGLMTRAYVELIRSDPGFDPERLLLLEVQLHPDNRREPRDAFAYAERALQALRETPGVEAAGYATMFGFLDTMHREPVTLSVSAQSGEQNATISSSSVTGELPGLLGMPVTRGRSLSRDGVVAAEEALVNESFARRYFPGGDPIGQRIKLSRKEQWLTIVGVVHDRHPLITQHAVEPELFMGVRHDPGMASNLNFLIQTRSSAKAMAKPIREAVARLNANQPVGQPAFISDLLTQRAVGPRNAMFLLGGLAAMGLFIAVMGVYGVVAFSVVERTREVGIRVALGASPATVRRLMLWHGVRLLLYGALPGLLIGALITWGIPAKVLLGNISPFDPLTYLCVVALVGAVGLCASLLPARRAANISPMEALRTE